MCEGQWETQTGSSSAVLSYTYSEAGSWGEWVAQMEAMQREQFHLALNTEQTESANRKHAELKYVIWIINCKVHFKLRWGRVLLDWRRATFKPQQTRLIFTVNCTTPLYIRAAHYTHTHTHTVRHGGSSLCQDGTIHVSRNVIKKPKLLTEGHAIKRLS